MKPEHVGYASAIASLPGVGPARLGVLWAAGEPDEVWRRICDGSIRRVPSVVESLGAKAETTLNVWRREGRLVEPHDLARTHATSGYRLLDAADDDYPSAFRNDLEPPLFLWVAGDVAAIRPHAVAIIGTRRCTRYGHDVARDLGRELAQAGVSVVSGLALGIDAAAHAGVLAATPAAAPPVGVVGTGLDVVYPRRNRALWGEVAARGVLLSESPPGATAERWRFPARNRLIAALVEMVVVVESGERGGSMYTVDEAVRRDVEVRAVPGPVTSPASLGTNRLLADGAAPALGASELLEVLGIHVVGSRALQAESGRADPAPGSDEAVVLDLLSGGPLTLDGMAEASELPLERLGPVIAGLQGAGLVVRSGGWYERAG